MESLAADFDLGDRLRHQIVHSATDLVVRLAYALGVEILADFPKYAVLAGFFEGGHDDFPRISVCFGPGETKLIRRPIPEELVAAGIRLKPQFLIVGELPLETFLAFV